MKIVSGLFVLLFILSFTEQSFSRPQYLRQLGTDFPKVLQLTTLRCNTCHGGSFFNAFGQDVAKFAFQQGKLDFSKVLDMDSNKNGISNRVELTNGTNPGVTAQPSLGH